MIEQMKTDEEIVLENHDGLVELINAALKKE